MAYRLYWLALVGAFFVGVFLVAASVVTGPANAAPGTPVNLAGRDASILDRVSFWGWPYPYGYSYHRGCYHRVRVETPNGWRWERVWVCRR